VSLYSWNFGDGKSATTSGQRTTHRYSKAGVYTVTLSVTDNEGCSAARIFTGQRVSCNGGSAAVGTAKLDTLPAISGLRARRAKRGATFRYRLTERARVRFSLSRRVTGRRVGGRCRPTSRRNAGRRKCKRLARITSFSANGKAGLNRTKLRGRPGKRKLPSGSYRVTGVATDRAGGKSRASKASFSVKTRRR
jgi:hypothetical protein